MQASFLFLTNQFIDSSAGAIRKHFAWTKNPIRRWNSSADASWTAREIGESLGDHYGQSLGNSLVDNCYEIINRAGQMYLFAERRRWYNGERDRTVVRRG